MAERLQSNKFREMTGAKLMFVRRGNCNLPSNEKPTVMVTSVQLLLSLYEFLRTKVRFLNKRYSEHLEKMSTRASTICLRIFLAEYGCSTSGADSTSIFWPAWT